MKKVTVLLAIILLGSWIGLLASLILTDGTWWFGLNAPASVSELGESIGILNGLFSAIAVILGLVAVLLQGHELRLATKAQNDQVHVLEEQVKNQKRLTEQQTEHMRVVAEQLKQQSMYNRIAVLQAKHQFHTAEHTRMDNAIVKILELPKESQDKGLLENCIKKRAKHLAELKEISNEIDDLKMTS